MSKYQELEKKWYRYKSKQFFKKFKRFAGGVAILTTVFGLFWFVNYSRYSFSAFFDTRPTQSSMSSILHKASSAASQDTFSSSSLASLNPGFLLADYSFENNLSFEKSRKNVFSQSKPPKKSTKKSHRSSSSPHLRISSENKSIEELIDSFSKHPTKELALLIAKTFYIKQQYAKTIKWSLKANTFDKTDPNTWILFAKSAYKMGKKERALEALRAYLEYLEDPRVKELYIQMVQGEFK